MYEHREHHSGFIGHEKKACAFEADAPSLPDSDADHVLLMRGSNDGKDVPCWNAGSADLENCEFGIVEALNGKSLLQFGKSVRIRLASGWTGLTWGVSGQDVRTNRVIHRPYILAHVSVADNEGNVQPVLMHGYSKRYFGPYPRYWCYHFMIHSSPKACFGSADARFGDDKYS